MFDGVVKGELSDSQRLCFSDDLKTFNHSGNSFMFESGVLAFGLFADNNSVDALMTSFNTGQADDMNNVSVEVKFVTQFHVKRLQFSSSAEIGSRENTFEADLVLFDRSDDILEWRAKCRVHLRKEERLEVNWNADRFENLLN